jgi:hypothetical protein
MGERELTTFRGRCIERDLGGGVLERHYLSPGEIIRPGGTPSVVGGRSAARSTVTATAKAPVFLDSLAPSHQVTLGFWAQQEIRKECRRMLVACRSEPIHETGGWLLAHPGSLDSIVAATPPGSDAEHQRFSMRLGSERLEAVRSLAPHMVPVGSWHLHPTDDPTPSPEDREAWAAWRKLDGVPFHVGLIVTRGETADPQLDAWITTEHFCEPLALRRQ